MERKVGLVIGGNRGIGKALTAALASRWGRNGKVYVTARQESDALQSRADLEEVTGLEIGWFTFDLSDPADPEKVSSYLNALHGGIDLVIQNGAYLPRAGYDPIDDARPMIEANSHGTLRVLEAFTPLLRENGHLMIVASALGVLENLPEHLRPAFNTKTHNPEQINLAIDQYVIAVEAGEASAAGWPDWVNIPSKVAQVAVTRSFACRARGLGRLPETATINAACPGVTLTDATREFMGTVFKEEEAQSPEVAAEGLLKMLLPEGEPPRPHAELLQHGQIIPFGD